MGNNVLMLKHISIEGGGTIEDYLVSNKWNIDKRELQDGDSVPSKLDYDAILILGGPMNVYEEDKYPFLKDEDKLIKEAIKKEIPTLGICLGAQLIAKASGAKVTKNIVRQAHQKEIGWYKVNLTDTGKKDSVFKGLGESFDVFQWHGDTFAIPEKGNLLSTAELCTNQALRVGKNIYGLQFHLEVTEDMIYKWIDSYDEELQSLKGVIDVEKIRRDTKSKFSSYKGRALIFCKNFFQVV
ncbi:MAG: type 1 glutamine amidotransferase [Nitrospinae bacterium]|nr:type 1 glutamine amidotransferase [Nitrospinota bacterium]